MIKIKAISIGLPDTIDSMRKSDKIEENVNGWLKNKPSIEVISINIPVMSPTHVIYTILYKDDWKATQEPPVDNIKISKAR